MKNFKQIINEISLGPKAGKEWSDYIGSMFGKETLHRPDIVEQPKHIQWFKKNFKSIPWMYGVPHENGMRMQDLPVTDVKHDGNNVQVHVDSSKYEEDLKRFRLNHGQAMNIPDFVDPIEDADIGNSHSELQARMSYLMKTPVRIHSIEYHSSANNQKPKLIFHMNADHIKNSQMIHNEMDDYDTRSGPEDWKI